MKKRDLDKINELTFQDLKDTNYKDLFNLTKKLTNEVNKQYDRWAKYIEKHPNSPLPNLLLTSENRDKNAIFDKSKLKEINDKYKGRLTKQELYLKFKDLREFVNSKTFTIKGFEYYKKSFRSKIKELTGTNIKYTKKFSNTFWNAYNKLTGHSDLSDSALSKIDRSKLIGLTSSQYDSNSFQAYLYQIYTQIKPKNEDELVDIIVNNLNEIEEEEEKYDTSNYFGFNKLL